MTIVKVMAYCRGNIPIKEKEKLMEEQGERSCEHDAAL